MKYYIALTALAVLMAGGCSSRPRAQGGEFEPVETREGGMETGKAAMPAPGRAQLNPLNPEGPTHRIAPMDSDEEESPDVFLPRKRYETLHI